MKRVESARRMLVLMAGSRREVGVRLIIDEAALKSAE